MKRLICASLLALCVAAPLRAEETEIQPDEFAVNNALSALFHEFGHLFVDQYDLPILGKEEDVADAIATLLLLKQDTDQSYYISYDTVDGYLMSSEIYGERDPDNVDFSDEHGLDLQRAYQMTCLLVGAKPDNFTELAVQVGLSDDRREGCADEYDQATRSWEQMIGGHLRSAKAEGAKLTVVYDKATGKYGPMETLLKSGKVLEQVADTVVGQFRLARPATVRATNCDEENAYYDGDADEITLCYEYVQFYYDLIADPESAGMELAEK